MAQNIDQQLISNGQKQALINEYKGNLLEFLTAKELADVFKIENEFLTSIGPGLTSRLQNYQFELRELDINLYRKLPQMAKDVVNCLQKNIEFVPTKIQLLGKLSQTYSSAKDSENSFQNQYGESDILLSSDSQVQGLSLKMVKDGAFINTKSAGIKSFFQQYFSLAKGLEFQERLNLVVERGFKQMSHRLHEIADLPFNGSFDSTWTNAGYSELPGQLPTQMREVLAEWYHQIIQEVYYFIQESMKDYPSEIEESWPRLCGFSSTQLWQVILFHKNKKDNMYESWRASVYSPGDFVDIWKSPTLQPLKTGLSSFEIDFKKFILQIRVKPMNKFTTAALKVNLSIKLKNN